MAATTVSVYKRICEEGGAVKEFLDGFGPVHISVSVCRNLPQTIVQGGIIATRRSPRRRACRLPHHQFGVDHDLVLQHRAVYDAIRQRRGEEAFLAMRRLLRNSKGNVFDALWMSRNEGEDRS